MRVVYASLGIWCTRFPQLVFYWTKFWEMQYTVNLTTIFQRQILVVFLTNQLSNYQMMTISCARLDIMWRERYFDELSHKIQLRGTYPSHKIPLKGTYPPLRLRVRAASRLWRWTRCIVWWPKVQKLAHCVVESWLITLVANCTFCCHIL